MYKSLKEDREKTEENENEQSIEANISPKKQFLRYFATPKKSKTVHETQMIDVSINSQCNGIIIGDNIEDHMLDDISLDFSDSQFWSQSDNCADENVGSTWTEINDIVDIFQKLMGINTLFPWQKEWLKIKEVMKDRSSFVYSAPTSAGKSLVSEVIMLKNALKYPNKLVIVMYPYISLINEKEK